MHKYLAIFILLGISGSASAFWGEATPQPKNHYCFVLKNNTVKCIGNNSNGQLGYGDTKPRTSRNPQNDPTLPFVNLGSGISALKVVMGTKHTCALLYNGRVKCWGNNDFGQLGPANDTGAGNIGDSSNEMGDNLLNTGLTNEIATDLYAQDNRTCVYYRSGHSECWGI